MKGLCVFCLAIVLVNTTRAQKATESQLAQKVFACVVSGNLDGLDVYKFTLNDLGEFKKMNKDAGEYDNDSELKKDFQELLATQKIVKARMQKSIKEEFSKYKIERKKTKYVTVNFSSEGRGKYSAVEFEVVFSYGNKKYQFDFDAVSLNGKWRVLWDDQFLLSEAEED
jgi:hypothetical protein